MALAEAMIPEFDHEMLNTRKTLERVPDDKLIGSPMRNQRLSAVLHHIFQIYRPGLA